MAFRKVEYRDKKVLISAKNMNDIQDAIIELEKLTDGVVVVNEASGSVVSIPDATNRGFMSFNIYGKTTQIETPTPDAPVELVSVGGGGSIGIAVAGRNVFQFCGENRIENGSLIESSLTGGTFQGNPGENPGSTSWSSGWAHFDRTHPMYLKAGTVITISADYTVLEKYPSAYGKVSILLDSHSDTSSLDIKNAEVGVKYRISRTLVVPEDGKYKRTTFTTHSSKVKIENVQWELGGVASDFVPYKEQTVSVSTPNGLSGISVAYGGNYTDSNGQAWLCDEIDLARGVKISRLFSYTITGDEVLTLYEHNDVTEAGNIRIEINSLDLPAPPSDSATALGICSHFKYRVTNKEAGSCWTYKNAGLDTCQLRFVDTLERFPSMEAFAAFAKAQYEAGTPIIIAYELEVPIETPLSEEELAAYDALHTYRDHTTVSNDAGAWMDLEYVMDAKKYIDDLMTGTIIPATVE